MIPLCRACHAPKSLIAAWLRASVLALILLAPSLGVALGSTEANTSPELFIGPNCSYGGAVASSLTTPEGLLRTLQVEERAGAAREDDLVRVPVFFAANECSAIDQLRIVPADPSDLSGPIPFQADDVRRGPDGGIGRAHLWFSIRLGARERKRFHLVKNQHVEAADSPAAMRASTSPTGLLTVSTDRGSVTFERHGGLVSITNGNDKWQFGAEGAHPNVVLSYRKENGAASMSVPLDAKNANPSMRWYAGPLFTKVSVRMNQPDGVALEQDFRIPRHGREVVITTAVFPGPNPGGIVSRNRLLETHGVAPHDAKYSVHTVGAGIREPLRSQHAYRISALTAASNAGALLAVPLVLGGTNGMWSAEQNGELALEGHQGLERGNEGEKRTLFAYWTEVRLVPSSGSSERQRWETYRSHVQPLVAVVDEPIVTIEQLHAALRDVVEEMKPVGPQQEAGRAWVLGDTKRRTSLLHRVGGAKARDLENLVNGARNAESRLTNQGQRKLREDEKGKAYGGLDPYHVTYTQSAAAALAALTDAPPSVAAANLAMARGVKIVGGRVDAGGFPYVDCFNRTLNMQLGPVLFGLTAGAAAGDESLVRFYRDLATSPLVKGVFGRGQRPYTGGPTTSAEQTDYLYQSICDFWLRTTELLAGENLELHPLAYSRYTDCIDVLADRYHAFSPKPKDGVESEVRANFFRGQAHTHRWLGWSCSPFIRLLEDPREQSVVGLTEAVRYARSIKGRWKNWPDLTFYILADRLVAEGLIRRELPSLPLPPTQVVALRTGDTTQLSWQPAAHAVEYRVYRADRSGGPYRWLNSPHVTAASTPLKEPRFSDAAARGPSEYVVTAVDTHGRESGWSNLKPAAATLSADGSGRR